MGRVRRGGYILEWWIGDHAPKHVHVFDNKGNLLGRIAVDTLQPLGDWKPSRKVIEIIQQLIAEGRL